MANRVRLKSAPLAAYSCGLVALLARQPTRNLVVVLCRRRRQLACLLNEGLGLLDLGLLGFFLGVLLGLIRPPARVTGKLSAGQPGRAPGTLCGELNAELFHVKHSSVQKPKNLGYGRAT